MNLPSNPELEKLALAIALQNDKTLPNFLSKIEKQDFFDDKSEYVFDAICEIFPDAIDLPILKNQLIQDNTYIKVGDGYLEELFTLKIDKDKLLGYIEILKNKSAKRKIISSLTSLVNDTYEEKKPVEDIITEVTNEILVVKKGINYKDNHILTSNNILETRLNEFKRKHALSVNAPMSGFDSLDYYMTTGFEKKFVSVIAGYTSIGKSAFKINLMNNMVNNGYKIVSFCCEQDFQSEMDRLQSLRTAIPMTNIINIKKLIDDGHKDASDKRFETIVDDAENIANSGGFNFVDKGYYTTQDVYLELLNIRNEIGPIDVVFIDLFDRLKDVGVTANKPQTIASKIAYLNNEVAVELDTHFCLVVQVNRSGVGTKKKEAKDVKRPSLDNLKDSASFAESADMVLLLHRPSAFLEGVEDDGLGTEVIIAKQRQGKKGTAIFDFEMEICKFWET